MAVLDVIPVDEYDLYVDMIERGDEITDAQTERYKLLTKERNHELAIAQQKAEGLLTGLDPEKRVSDLFAKWNANGVLPAIECEELRRLQLLLNVQTPLVPCDEG